MTTAPKVPGPCRPRHRDHRYARSTRSLEYARDIRASRAVVIEPGGLARGEVHDLQAPHYGILPPNGMIAQV